MDFQLSEESRALQEMAAEFARQKLLPFASSWDKDADFPVEVLREAAALGMGAMLVAEEVGGSNLSRLDTVLIYEQLATGCVTTSAYLSIHNMVAFLMDRYASDDLRHYWCPRLASMTSFASYCLTEPEAGSDAASLKTTARREGDHYILNGSKAFISGAPVSDLYLCMARTSEQGAHGITAFVIEKNTPGLYFGPPESKMGWRNQPTAMVHFENCRIPLQQRIGEEGEGFKIALNALNGGRLSIAACSLGGALHCLRLSQQYLNERKQFGKKLAQMQALRFYFADMWTHFSAAKLLVYRAALALENKDRKAPMYCAMAKRLASDVAFQISDKALQLHGGYGYLQDYQVERIFRDLRVHQILEGTNEIMREIIAKTVLDEAYFLE